MLCTLMCVCGFEQPGTKFSTNSEKPIGSWGDFLNVSQLDFISTNGWHPIVSSLASISAIPIGRVFPPWLHGPAIQPSRHLDWAGQCCNCTVLYYTVLYCTILYCTLLYCTVLYCTVLCLTVHPLSSNLWHLVCLK